MGVRPGHQSGAEGGWPPLRVRVTTDVEDVLRDPEVEAVAIATPAWTHAARYRAMQAGKHVMIEKPLATTVA